MKAYIRAGFAVVILSVYLLLCISLLESREQRGLDILVHANEGDTVLVTAPVLSVQASAEGHDPFYLGRENGPFGVFSPLLDGKCLEEGGYACYKAKGPLEVGLWRVKRGHLDLQLKSDEALYVLLRRGWKAYLVIPFFFGLVSVLACAAIYWLVGVVCDLMVRVRKAR